jgi:predicted ATPase with chaperone activity
VKPLVPENINVNVNTGAVADLAELSDRVADNMMAVIFAFTACSIVRNLVLAVIKK